jgi:hypothetical protein
MRRHVKRQVYVTLLALLAVVVMAAPAAAQEEETNVCFSTHTAGVGPTFMQICISSHGNLVKFESPAGFEQIGQFNVFRDGYAICSQAPGAGPNTNHAFDAGGGEAGWGPPIVTQPNGANTFPLTITRLTADGMFQLKQTFARDTKEQDVTITMSVVNKSVGPRENVRISRYFENDVDNNSALSRLSRGVDSVWGWVEGAHAFSLTALTFPTPHVTQLESLLFFRTDLVGPQSARGCAAAVPAAGPVGPSAADYAGRVTYLLGNLAKGAGKTVKVVYRRF